MSEVPDNGWWPEKPVMCQWLRRSGQSIAQVVKSNGQWRAYSMVELNTSGTTGKPLSDSSTTFEEAKKQCEFYAEYPRNVLQ